MPNARPRKKIHDADVIQRKPVIARMGPHVPDRALRVAQLNWVVIAGTQSLSQNKCTDSELVQPCRDIVPLFRE